MLQLIGDKIYFESVHVGDINCPEGTLRERLEQHLGYGGVNFSNRKLLAKNTTLYREGYEDGYKDCGKGVKFKQKEGGLNDT